jgi:hypothetical protein
MKKYLSILALIILFTNCSSSDEATFTLEVNVFSTYFNDNKLLAETGAEVYVFEFIEAWTTSINEWDYEYLDNGFIREKTTNETLKYSQMKLTTISGADFQIPEGLHTVVVKSMNKDEWTMFKINMNKDKVSEHNFK